MPKKVLVVDDSLFMRTLISDMLNSDPEIEVVDTAKDGSEAIKKIPETNPDCITLDLAMPHLDGLATLKHIMAEYPTPVVILSAHSRKDADITIECLSAGAVGFVLKPSGELSLDIGSIKRQLLEEVKAASKVNVGKIKSLIVKKPRRPRRKLIGINETIVIGASTGGPRTLETILSSLPSEFSCPIIVVQHVPTLFFSQSLADHLNRNCQLEVKVADNNEVIEPGKVYLAPSGFQMTLKRPSAVRIPYTDRNTDNGMRTTDVIISLIEDKSNELTPSVDITMKSVAQIYDGAATGIILSGMGRDGLEGMKAIKKSGGKTIAQDESSLIFGMPREVIDAGYADKVLPMAEIAGVMVESVS